MEEQLTFAELTTVELFKYPDLETELMEDDHILVSLIKLSLILKKSHY